MYIDIYKHAPNLLFQGACASSRNLPFPAGSETWKDKETKMLETFKAQTDGSCRKMVVLWCWHISSERAIHTVESWDNGG